MPKLWGDLALLGWLGLHVPERFGARGTGCWSWPWWW